MDSNDEEDNGANYEEHKESNQRHEIKTSEIAIPSYVEKIIGDEDNSVNALKELFGETIVEIPNNQYPQNNIEEYEPFENNYLQEKIEPKDSRDSNKKPKDEVLDIF
jgi:hypothetical protein